MLKTYTTVEVTCYADEVENNKKELSTDGYCWELSRFPNETNPYWEYLFRIFVIIMIKLGIGRGEPS